jgi:molybdate transport system substrate-binding protein
MLIRVLCLLAMVLPLGAAAAPKLSIFAAASLTDALGDIHTLWLAKGHDFQVNFASSSTLAQQIEHGAPADVFISADELWMDRLQKKKRIDPATRSDLVGNTLVLVERRENLKPFSLGPGANLSALLGPGGRLAVGDPTNVPAGIYAKQALEKLGLWDSVKDRLAPADSVRSAVLLVGHGETQAGIVYLTDIKTLPGLGVAATFPADSHDPIRYPVAVTTRASLPEATDFLAFLHSEQAQDVFRHYGFTAP